MQPAALRGQRGHVQQPAGSVDVEDMEEGDAEGEGPMVVKEGPSRQSLQSESSTTTTTNLLASVKEQELQFERLTRELEEERQIVASQLEKCMLGAESPAGDSSSSSEKSYAWRSAGGESQGVATEVPGHHSEVEEGLYMPEGDRASLHDSEGSGGHSAHMTSYSDSGYQDSSVSYYSNQNVVRSEPRASISRSPRAEGQASGQASSRMLRRMASLPSRSQSPGCGTTGTVSPSRISMRTSQGRMTAMPQHYGSTLPRQSQSLAYGADPYGLYQRSALPRPDSLIGLHSSYAGHRTQIDPELRAALSPDCQMTPVFDDRSFQSPLYHSPTHDPQGSLYRANTGMGTLPRTTSHCGTLPYQRSSYGLSSAAAYVDSIRVSTEPVYSHRHSALVDRVITRTPSIESIHKDPREFAWRDPELPEVIHMLQHHFPSVQANAAAYLQHLCYGDNRVKVEVCHLGGIQHLVDLLDHKTPEVQKSACGALRNLVYGKATDNNKVALRNCGGVPALLRLLRKTTDNEVRELVTGRSGSFG
ncbi:hypothetical protein CRENBAI_022739 [Crenichthys baileyi]|uniref:Plakophilin 4 n=1 Tax=Crenichthys baileyi TaxID=28760 RepID=A0AAV9SB68_9TELE